MIRVIKNYILSIAGHVDFTIEVERAIRVLDGAVTILDGVAGVEAQTKTVWNQAKKYKIPSVLYVNKLDREGADFSKCILDISTKLDNVGVVIPCHIPFFKNKRFDIVDLVQMKLLNNGDDGYLKHPSVTKARLYLLETLAELDETFMEIYCNWIAEDIAEDACEIEAALRRLTLKNMVVPVFCGSSLRDVGVADLLDSIIKYLPSPSDLNPPKVMDNNNIEQVLLNTSPSCALAFKVVHDMQKGPLVFVRVYSGSISRKSQLLNSSNLKKEKAASLYELHADQYIPIESISAGNIGIIAGLVETKTGDTLMSYPNDPNKIITLETIVPPPPVFICAIEPESSSEEKSLKTAISYLQNEDPSFHFKIDKDTGQYHISGMGELHLDILIDRLVNSFKIKCRKGNVWISYRETFRKNSMFSHEFHFDKIINGKNACVNIRGNLNCPEDMEGNKIYIRKVNYVDESPLNYNDVHKYVKEGIEAALLNGPLLGYPVCGTVVTIESIDIYKSSCETSLRSCALDFMQTLFSESIPRSECSLLEPVMTVEISASEKSLGSIMTDICSNRDGQILTLGESDNTIHENIKTDVDKIRDIFDLNDHITATNSFNYMGKINALVPLSSMIGYSKIFRSQTKGHGSLTMALYGYLPMRKDRIEKEIISIRGYN